MLAQCRRLRQGRDICRVFANRRSWSSEMAIVYVRKSPDRTTRFAFSTTKKLGGAVQRNRIRRRLRETCRALLPCVVEGLDVVIVGKLGALRADYDDVFRHVEKLLRSAGAIGPG